MNTSRLTTLFALTLILLLAAASRIVHIDLRSLWVDEGYAYYHANQPDLILSLSRDTHPPLYFAALRVWEMMAGKSALALRFFSVLPSMLSVALIYRLAQEFVRERGGSIRTSVVPVLAVLLMALADAEGYLSQEVRHYTWHVFFVVCSMWAFLRWIRMQKRSWLALWVVATVLLLYTHYIGMFTVIVQGLYALVFLRGKVRLQALGGLLLSGLLLSPWLLLVGVKQVGNRGANWSFDPTSAVINDITVKWFSYQWPLMIGLALLGTVIIVYPGLRDRWRITWRPIGPAVLLVTWVVLPIVLMYLGNSFIPLLSSRRLSQITPAVALLVAFGLGNLRHPARGFLVAVIVVYSVTHLDFEHPQPDWRAIAELTTVYAEPSDLVLTNIDGGDYHMLYYYEQMLPPDTAVRSLKEWRDFEPDTYTSGGPALVAQYDTVWLLQWSSDGQIFPWLAQSGHVETLRMPVDNLGSELDIYRYDRLLEEPVATYENGMSLRDFAFDTRTLRADLLWSVDTPTDSDYTTSAFLLDAGGQLVAQDDSLPFNGERPTTGWLPGQVVYDPKPLELQGIDSLPPGDYQVGVQVYTWTPEGTVRARTTAGDEWAIVGEITITGTED